MATIDVSIASRRYSVACRDGEEDHLRSAAAVVDEKAKEAASALGNLPEARQLLFASLLLADDLMEAQAGGTAARHEPVPDPDRGVGDALERLAEGMEALANRLESGRGTS